MVKILFSGAGDTTSAPGQGVKIPHASQPRKTHTEAILTNSTKTLKKVHINKKECKTLTTPQLKNTLFQDLPGGPVLRTPHFLCSRQEFHP